MVVDVDDLSEVNVSGGPCHSTVCLLFSRLLIHVVSTCRYHHWVVRRVVPAVRLKRVVVIVLKFRICQNVSVVAYSSQVVVVMFGNKFMGCQCC